MGRAGKRERGCHGRGADYPPPGRVASASPRRAACRPSRWASFTPARSSAAASSAGGTTTRASSGTTRRPRASCPSRSAAGRRSASGRRRLHGAARSPLRGRQIEESASVPGGGGAGRAARLRSQARRGGGGGINLWTETARCFDSGRRRPPLSMNGVGARPFHPSRVRQHQHLQRICADLGGQPRRPQSRAPAATIRASGTRAPPADPPRAKASSRVQRPGKYRKPRPPCYPLRALRRRARRWANGPFHALLSV